MGPNDRRKAPPPSPPLPLFLAGLGVALLLLGGLVKPRPGSEERFSFLSDPLDPIPEAQAITAPFQVIESGLLRVEYPGRYYFGAKAADGIALLRIDAGNAAIEVGSEQGALLEPVALAAGAYPFRLTYVRRETAEGTPRFGAFWSREIDRLRPIPPSKIFPPTTAPWRFRVGHAAPVTGTLVVALAGLVAIGSALPPPRRRALWFGMIAVSLSLAGGLVIAEVALRVFGVGPIEYIKADQAEHYRFNEPGAEMRYSGWMPYLRKEFETTLRFNSFRLRDEEHALLKPPGVFRIAVLGDSFVEAKEVELVDTFHRRLEHLLNGTGPAMRYEVLAFGLGGTTTSQHVELYQGLVRRFDVDLVVLVFFAGNDVMEISPELSAEFSDWIRDVHVDRLMRAKIDWLDHWRWLESSRVGQLVADRTMRLYVQNLYRFQEDLEKDDLVVPLTGVFHESYDARWSRAWELVHASIAELAGMLERDGVRFLLANVDALHMLEPRSAEMSRESGIDADRPAREVSRICETERVQWIDLSPVMKRLREQRVAYRWPEDGHWSPEGHRVVAEALCERLGPLLNSGPGAAGSR